MVEYKKITFKISVNLRNKIKARAAERNMSMMLFINQILSKEIAAIEKREVQKIKNQEN